VASIFISHSSKDAAFVVGYLKPLLEQYGLSVWCSTADLNWGVDWERQLQQELLNADWFIVVLSPDAADSDWVRAEVHWAMEKRKGSLIPVMLHTCDPAAIHLRLGTVQFIDFRHDVEASAQNLLNWLRGRTMLSPIPGPSKTEVAPIDQEQICRITALFDLTIDNSTSRQVSLTIDRQCTLGRGVDVDFALASATVSRYHARLLVVMDMEGKHLEIVDLQSSNGTYVNGARIEHSQRLEIGDRITLGTVVLQLRQVA
jgi:hypothetical protein